MSHKSKPLTACFYTPNSLPVAHNSAQVLKGMHSLTCYHIWFLRLSSADADVAETAQ